MQRKEFIERWKHDLAGMILEAMTTKRPDSPLTHAELGVRTLALLEKVEKRLGQMWDDLAPKEVKPEPKPANGNVPQQPQTQGRK